MSLTNTFPPEILPASSGVYLTTQIDPETGEPTDTGIVTGYSHFDAKDKIWGCTHATVEEAAAHPEYEFAHQTKIWQGLAEEPKA
jgi:hypothetical protein